MDCAFKQILFRYALYVAAALILIYLWNRLFKRFKFKLSLNHIIVMAIALFFLTIIPCLSFGGKGKGGSGMRGNAGSSGSSSSTAGSSPSSIEWTIRIESKGREQLYASIDTDNKSGSFRGKHGPFALHQNKGREDFLKNINDLRKDRVGIHVRLVLPASLKADVSIRAIEQLLRSTGLVIQGTEFSGAP